MQLGRKRFMQLAAASALWPAASRFAVADDYPTRPVHLVVPVPPAGTFDIVARLVAHAVEPHLHQQIIIDNRGGAGTNLGTGVVARAAPDGYTLLLAGSPGAINVTLYRHLDFSFPHDIAPVASIERAPLIAVVNPSFPAKTIPEFISYAKANPGKINLGSGGAGSTGHVAGELFNMMAGTQLVNVPYRSNYMPDMLSGQVQGGFPPILQALNFIRAGKLRALAVTSKTRSDSLPGVPTVAEFVPGYEAVVWDGIAAPARTPPDIIEKLNKEINAVLGDPAIKKRMADLGSDPMIMSAAQFGAFEKSEAEKWGKVVKTAGIKAE